MATKTSLLTIMHDNLADTSAATVISAEKTYEISSKLDFALEESQKAYIENEAEANSKLAQLVLTS